MTTPPMSPNAWLRYDMIRQMLEDIPRGSSFVEVGCGMGALAARLVDRYEYVGYEPDALSSRTAALRVGSHGLVINAALPSTPTETFDVLGAFEVLEHLEDDEVCLAGWREWIRPGGHLLLSVPANPKRFAAADVVAGHYRRYSKASLLDVLERAGFHEISVWTYGFPLGYVLELARNVLATGVSAAHATLASRTAASGRLYQPDARFGWATALGTLPFRLVQRPFRHSSLGTGLVAMARRP